MSRSEFLRDLAHRIFRIPVMYGVDQCDHDQLLALAADLDAEGSGQKPAPFDDPEPAIEDMLS